MNIRIFIFIVSTCYYKLCIKFVNLFIFGIIHKLYVLNHLYTRTFTQQISEKR